MNNLTLIPQMLLGFSGECSSSSCEAGQAKEYMKNMLKFSELQKNPKTISANRLIELSRELKANEKESLKTRK